MIDRGAFRRLLGERCLSAEEFRRTVGVSPTTMAKVNRGEPVADAVFRRIVLGLQQHPALPMAQQLLPGSRETGIQDPPSGAVHGSTVQLSRPEAAA
ncbi:MAG: hypothetical protein M3072_12015 [Candidatus Dormibacteraeota bacterium]|nr:hypothetical protein [Candidatus Dormibacteraeota bacterium]